MPVAINGVELSLVELISSLETIAGAHGVGSHRHDARTAADQARAIYEAPAAAVAAAPPARSCSAAACPRDLMRMLRDLAASYADLIDNGRWFTPAREALDALARRRAEAI